MKPGVYIYTPLNNQPVWPLLVGQMVRVEQSGETILRVVPAGVSDQTMPVEVPAYDLLSAKEYAIRHQKAWSIQTSLGEVQLNEWQSDTLMQPAEYWVRVNDKLHRRQVWVTCGQADLSPLKRLQQCIDIWNEQAARQRGPRFEYALSQEQFS